MLSPARNDNRREKVRQVCFTDAEGERERRGKRRRRKRCIEWRGIYRQGGRYLIRGSHCKVNGKDQVGDN